MTIAPPMGNPSAAADPSIRSRGTRFQRDVMGLRPDLQRTARRYTANAWDAEDLVQETLAKAWVGFDSFQPGTRTLRSTR